MARMTKLFTFVFWVALMMTTTAAAQTQSPREALSVQGYSGQTNVMRFQGRVFVDVQELGANHKRLTQLQWRQSRSDFAWLPAF